MYNKIIIFSIMNIEQSHQNNNDQIFENLKFLLIFLKILKGFNKK